MQNTRINQNYPREYGDDLFRDDIVQSVNLESYFDKILTDPTDYIQDSETTTKLNARLSGKNDAIFLIGYRNTGKTTFLKKHFNIKYNTTVMREETLIVPMLGLGDVEKKTPYQYIASTVRGICDILEFNCDKDVNNLEDFYAFILETRVDYLPALDFSQTCRLSPRDRKAARIDKMQHEQEIGYYLTRLKFLLGKDRCRIKKIVFILDNIQNIFADSEKQREVVSRLLQTFECLASFNNERQEKDLKLHVIISVRPHNYRILKKDQHILPYTAFPIWKNNKYNSEKLLEEVMTKYGAEIMYEVVTLHPGMEGFHDGVLALSKRLRRAYSEMIEKLCFYDIVLITEAYKRILLNQTWLKADFKYRKNSHGYLFDNITWKRALACGNSKVYHRPEYNSTTPRIEKLVPNLLYNENEEDTDCRLLILYTMKYFLRKYDKHMECGEKYIQLEDYFKDFLTVFDVEEEKLMHIITYMYKTEILRRSIHDVDKADKADPDDEEVQFDKKNKLYITVRGSKLWDMLKDDSVLFEICREDIYQKPGSKERMKPSYDFLMEGMQPLLFEELLKLIEELFEEEYRYYKTCCDNGIQEMYQKIFGKNSIIRNTLLQGVMNSIRYSGFGDVADIAEKLNDKIVSEWEQVGV